MKPVKKTKVEISPGVKKITFECGAAAMAVIEYDIDKCKTASQVLKLIRREYLPREEKHK